MRPQICPLKHKIWPLRMDGCKEIHPCVLQDIGSLGPLPCSYATSSADHSQQGIGYRWPSAILGWLVINLYIHLCTRPTVLIFSSVMDCIVVMHCLMDVYFIKTLKTGKLQEKKPCTVFLHIYPSPLTPSRWKFKIKQTLHQRHTHWLWQLREYAPFGCVNMQKFF